MMLPAPPTLAQFVLDDRQRRTTPTRSPATRAAHVPSSAARRATPHLQPELCSLLYMRPTTLAFTYLATASSDYRLPDRFAYTGREHAKARRTFAARHSPLNTCSNLLSFRLYLFVLIPARCTARFASRAPNFCFHFWTH
jgi:hypothetical protein